MALANALHAGLTDSKHFTVALMVPNIMCDRGPSPSIKLSAFLIFEHADSKTAHGTHLVQLPIRTSPSATAISCSTHILPHHVRQNNLPSDPHFLVVIWSTLPALSSFTKVRRSTSNLAKSLTKPIAIALFYAFESSQKSTLLAPA